MIRFLIFSLLSIAISGCTTKNKAIRYMNKHPKVLSEICSEKYPVKTEYKPGKTLLKTDTITITDSVKINVDCPDGTKIVADCPPNTTKTIKDSIIVVDTILVENTAKTEFLNYKIEELKSVIKSKEEILVTVTKRRDQYLKWLLLFGGVLSFIILNKIYKFMKAV